ncbi:MAG TPA: hypothetical protein VMD75_01105 [Candidatus Binataceae bacterium]|nr:hypothetical protein [Candidatus Binataceae bacterium]
MSEDQTTAGPAAEKVSRENWSVPRPEKIPPPTYWPAMTALGIAFILFGIVTSWAFSATGAVMFVLSVGKWIGELVRDG